MIISVIAIFYNSAPYVKRCINSILNQRGVNIELIAIDDCSKDETLSILQTYHDPRMKVFSNETNQGISRTRNRGISHVNGDCFYLIDGDDWLPEGALATLAEKWKDNVDWVQGAYAICNEDGHILHYKSNISNEYISHEEIENNFSNLEFIYTHNRLINRKYCTHYFPIDLFHEDRFWNVRIFNNVSHIVNVDIPTYNYVAHQSSFSSRSRSDIKYIESALLLYQEMSQLPICWNTIKQTFLITAIEKNLYLWDFPKTIRIKILKNIRQESKKVDINYNGFPRFSKYIHKMICSGIPDTIISMVSAVYVKMSTLMNRPY